MEHAIVGFVRYVGSRDAEISADSARFEGGALERTRTSTPRGTRT